MLQNVTDSSHEIIIQNQINYLLHIKLIGKQYENVSFQKQSDSLVGGFHNYTFNPKVLVVLIETGYC